MELNGANSFRTKAYRNGARIILGFQSSAEDAIKSGEISKKKGIGKGLTDKLVELVTTGEIQYLIELRAKLPKGLFEMQKIPGMGPKRIKTLYQDLKISSVKELEAACKEGSVAKLPRFGNKLQAQILDEIEHLGETAIRRPREEVLPVAIKFGEHFLNLPYVIKAKIAGSLRRGKATVKDVDLLVSSNEPTKVMEEARSYPSQKIIASGNTKTSLRLEGGLQVDVRVVSPESFACALAYFTGSKDFNVKLRQLALEKGYSLNEYALRPLDGTPPPAIHTEKELHQKLGLQYIPAELRETDAEILKQLGNQ